MTTGSSATPRSFVWRVARCVTLTLAIGFVLLLVLNPLDLPGGGYSW